MPTEDLLKLALGCLSAIGGILMAGIGFLYREAKRAGVREAKLDQIILSQNELRRAHEDIGSMLDRVTEHEVRIETIEKGISSIRSDLTDLLRSSRDWSGYR